MHNVARTLLHIHLLKMSPTDMDTQQPPTVYTSLLSFSGNVLMYDQPKLESLNWSWIT